MRRILLLATALGCGATESPNNVFRNQTDAYAVAQPVGWTTSNDHGATRFAPRSGKQTIVVRSALRPQEIVEGKPTTDDDLVAATARVLVHLSRARILGQNALEGGELAGVRFTLTFVPRGQRVAYQRVHAVLFGARHVFHVIATAPQGESIDQSALNEMISTLTEEG